MNLSDIVGKVRSWLNKKPKCECAACKLFDESNVDIEFSDVGVDELSDQIAEGDVVVFEENCGCDGCRNVFSSELDGQEVSDQNRCDLSKRTIDALKRLTERMNSGEDIKCTRVCVETTPDGPLTTRTETTLNKFLEEKCGD